MKLLKTIILSVALISLFSCSERLSPKRSDAEQQQVKEQVMKLLKEEYHQPFKLKEFNYKYDTKYKYGFLYKKGETSGLFKFKIQAINNPIISTDFYIFDGEKGSIKSLINAFKKNQLNSVYCMGLTNYYRYINNNSLTLKQPYTEQAEKYCSSIGQERYKLYQNYYLKHHIN